MSCQITKLLNLELFFLLRVLLSYPAAPSSSYAHFRTGMESIRTLPELTTSRSWSFSLLLEWILLCTARHLHFQTQDFILNPQCCSIVTSGQGIFQDITGRGCTLYTASDSSPTSKAGRLFPMMGLGWGDSRVNNLFPIQFSALSFRSTRQSLGSLSQLIFRTRTSFE